MKQTVAIVAALAWVAASAVAATRDSFDSHCADVELLQVISIQKELAITSAQRTKMIACGKAHAAKVDALRKKLGGAKVDPSRTLYDYYIQLKVQILDLLTAAQVRRLREISLQRIGLLALCDPVVSKRVGLSDGQVKRLRATYDEGFAEFKTIENAEAHKVLAPYVGRNPKTPAEASALKTEVDAKIKQARAAVMPRLDAIKAEYDKKMRAIMTTAQYQTYEDLRGRPFKG